MSKICKKGYMEMTKKIFLETLKSALGPTTFRASNLAEYQLKLGGPNQVMWSFDHVVTWKIKNLLSAFQQHLWQPNLAEQRLRVADTIPQVTWTCNQWLCGHLLNIFKAPAAIILKILGLLSVVLRFLDDKIILMLSYLTFRSSPP